MSRPAIHSRGSLHAVLILSASCCIPSHAHANGILPDDYPNAAQINRGRELFFNETFNGNGRTCGTCHPAENNFTIDPEFIATLPDDSPLFVAERPQPNPLAENFEKPELMRKLGLILENTNGFDDLENNFTMRSVPHLHAMLSSITPPSDMANDGTSSPPDERTGWSGDGAPTDPGPNPQLHGTIRDFTVGAIRQHFPKTLGREAGVDFRLPTAEELDALEAFMFSLGRQNGEEDITQIAMTDLRAERGRLNYMGEGVAGDLNCNACHFNGGANTDPTFVFPASVTPPAFEETNRSFAPRVEELLDQPGDVIVGGEMPFDDGFGNGSNLFNVPPVIEAADTGPFFHANQIETVEGMVAFYSSQRHFRDGSVAGAIVALNGSQVANVAAFVRVLNADENARQAMALVEQARGVYRNRDRRLNLRLARHEIEDAVRVLREGRLHAGDAIPLLEKADRKIQQERMNRAIQLLRQARTAMINRPPS